MQSEAEILKQYDIEISKFAELERTTEDLFERAREIHYKYGLNDERTKAAWQLHKDSLLKLTEGKLKVLETKQKAITSLRKGVLKVTDPVSRKDIRITFLENVSPEDVGQGFYARFGEADVKRTGIKKGEKY